MPQFETREPPRLANPSESAPLSVGASRYALGLLVVVSVFNFIDRLILSILLEDIKQTFDVSDTYLGFLSGIAFALFYTIWASPSRVGRIAASGPPSSPWRSLYGAR